MLLSFHQVSFTYEGALNPLFDGVGASFPEGWTGIVGANGAGKTTFLRLACGELEAHQGRIHRPAAVIYCAQRTDDPPDLFPDFVASSDAEACILRGRLRIGDDWLHRWNTLSHGERKRVQIAVALWQAPDVLSVDEPTNHIDADVRALLMDALSTFGGIGLIVSHDRELLDTLCGQCLFIEPPYAVMRPGGYTEGSAQARLEDEHIRDEYDQAKTAAQKLRREAIRRHQEAERANRMRSKRRIAPRDHDAKGRIDAARISGADGKAGRLASQLDGRVQQAHDRLFEFSVKRRYETDFWLPGSRSHRDILFGIPAGELPLGERRRLVFPDLVMGPGDRVAVTGPNGFGKSTLIRHIRGLLTLPEEKVIYVPQEIDLPESRRIMAEVNALSRDQLGRVMTLVSGLGSRPERLIGNLDASPGEIRKVLLALGVARSPHLIIMDEPTNHLDLPAIECLENALDACPCGLLLVSHDYRFLSRLAQIRWHLSQDGPDVRLAVISMDAG